MNRTTRFAGVNPSQRRLLAAHRDFGNARTHRTANERVIEGHKGDARWSTAQVQGVSKLNSMSRQCKSGCDRWFILSVHVFEAKQLDECIADSALLKSIQATQDPTCFKQYRFRDPNWLGCEQRSRGGSLFWVVPGQQSDYYISIDRGHDVALPRVESRHSSAQASSICV